MFGTCTRYLNLVWSITNTGNWKTEHGSIAITVSIRMQNCGSMRAEAYFDRVNTPRIVSFSKARMFHGSRSSAIPFYLLFRNSGTRQQYFASRPAICVRVFNSILNTCPRSYVSSWRSWPSVGFEIENSTTSINTRNR